MRDPILALQELPEAATDIADQAEPRIIGLHSYISVFGDCTFTYPIFE